MKMTVSNQGNINAANTKIKKNANTRTITRCARKVTSTAAFLLITSTLYPRVLSFCPKITTTYATTHSSRQQTPKQQFNPYLQQLSSSSSQENENVNTSAGNFSANLQINYLDQSRLDTEQRPKRLIRRKKSKSSSTSSSTNDNGNKNDQNDNNQNNYHLSSKERAFMKWGVTKQDKQNPQQPLQEHTNANTDTNTNNISCATTVNSVAQDCFHAISSTLYCRNFLDPNIASNAMAVSVNDKRPVGFAYWPKGRDVGRLGVEIDNARFLIKDHTSLSGSSSSVDETRGDSTMISNGNSNKHHLADVEGRALRRVVLLLASKLSQTPWAGLEEEEEAAKEEVEMNGIQNEHEHKHNHMNKHNGEKGVERKKKKTRPIAIYFNTLSQTLMASRELQLLQQVAIRQNLDVSLYQNIRILCLGQDTIPKEMTQSGSAPANSKTNGDKKKGRRKWGSSRQLSSGSVDPKKGMIIIVQPSDYNYESKPPSPSIGTVQELQKLLSRASVNQIPSIVISPRLTEQLSGNTGIEQSGYQQSSTYGGVEPPKGPTPWLLRDFIPPVYSWIGCALEVSSHRPPPPPSPLSMNSLTTANGYDDDHHKYDDYAYSYSYYSRVAMTQTVMESGHPWHLFAVENNVEIMMTSPSSTSSSSSQQKRHISYQYMASTHHHSGRPSRDLLRDLLSDLD